MVIPDEGKLSKVEPDPEFITVSAVSKLYALPIFPFIQPPVPAVIVPVFAFPVESFADVPDFSSSFHSPTGELHDVESPGMQYSRAAELSFAPAEVVDVEPKVIPPP
jgi:hypothetical protein